MSAEDTDRRASTAPLVLLWIAIALAPVAGTLVVLGGGSGLLRAGGALAMLAVVLVALGSVLARAGTGGRAGGDVEAYVGDEIEALRVDIRADISRATKASHRVLGEQIAALGDTVEALRGQIEVLRSHVERNHLAAPAPPPAQVGAGHGPVTGVAGVPGGMFSHTETVQVTTRQTTIGDTGYGDRTGSVYGGGASTATVPGQRRGEFDAYKGRDEYTDRDGYAGGRRARQDDEPTGGWAASREVHLGERSSEVRVDDTAAQMRTQDRWASMVERDAEPAPARPAAESTGGGRRRRDDDDDHARYWSNFHAETTQQRGGEPGRGSEPGWGTDRGAAEPTRAAEPTWAASPARAAEPATPALPAGPSGEPVPAWAGGRSARGDGSVQEPARVPAEAAQYRGTQYGATESTSATGYGGGTEYGRSTGDHERTGGGYGRAGGGGEYGGTQYGGSTGGTGQPGGGYGQATGGTQYGQTGGGTEYGGQAQYGTQPQYGTPAQYGGHQHQDAGHDNRYQGHQSYQDDEPTGRRSRHGDWR